MTDNNEISIEKVKYIRTNYLDPVVWSQFKGMASVFLQSGALPAHFTNVSQIIFAMQKGLEMGMKPTEAIESLYFVHGACNIWGKAIVKRLRDHGWTIKYEDTPDSCTATVSKGDESYTETYTFEDAKASKYTLDRSGNLKPGWFPGINRRLKLRYGVLGIIIKSNLAEVMGSATNIQEVAEDVEIDIQDTITQVEMSTGEQKAESLQQTIEKRKEKIAIGDAMVKLASTAKKAGIPFKTVESALLLVNGVDSVKELTLKQIDEAITDVAGLCKAAEDMEVHNES